MSILNYLQPLNQYALNVVRVNKGNISTYSESLSGVGSFNAEFTAVAPMAASIDGMALMFAAGASLTKAAAVMRGVAEMSANLTYDCTSSLKEPFRGSAEFTADAYQAIFSKYACNAEFSAHMEDFREGGLSIEVKPTTFESSGNIVITLDERD